MPHAPSKKPKSRVKSKPALPTKPASRKLKQPAYRPFSLKKRIKHPSVLPSAWYIFKASIRHLYAHKRLFGSIVLIYLALTFLLVRGFGFNGDLGTAKEAIQELISGTAGHLAASLTVFGMLLGSGSPTSDVASAYQAMILTVVSLVLIWALRQTHAHEQITVKNAFYKSSYPLVPFVLVLMILGLQLLPMLVGNFIYSLTVASGVAATVIEKIVWAGLALGLTFVSIYMVCASVFALYIVTLPDMTPLKAIRSAKTLVRYRRWTIIRKVLFLPFILGLLFVVIMLPVILVLTPAAEVVFLLLSAASVAMVHSYMYSLYREIL